MYFKMVDQCWFAWVDDYKRNGVGRYARCVLISNMSFKLSASPVIFVRSPYSTGLKIWMFDWAPEDAT